MNAAAPRESAAAARWWTWLAVGGLIAGAGAVRAEEGELDFLFRDAPAEERPEEEPSRKKETDGGAPEPRPAPAAPKREREAVAPAPAPAEISPAETTAGGPPGEAPEPPPVAAPAAVRRRVLEEVIVTAQKTEQSLRDVPISMTVMSGEFLERQNVTDFNDLAIFVPNTRIDAGTAFPDVRIRGFGSPLSNKGFEQSVGLLVDGVPYSRLGYYQLSLFDVERVEVLRGPQGTLLGKNTTAGVMSVVTRQPSDSFTGDVGVEYGELDRYRLFGAVGGPAVPGLVNFRLALLDEARDGYLRNTTARILPGIDDRVGFRERRGIRASLGFPDVFGASFVFSYERSEADLSATWAFRRVTDKLRPFFLGHDPNTDFDPENQVTSLNETGESTRDLDRFILNGAYDLPGGWGLDLVGEMSGLDWYSLSDVDFTPVDMFATLLSDENPQKTAELRLSSPSLPGLLGIERLFGFALGQSDLTTGFFFQRRELLDSVLRITLNVVNVAELAAFQNSPDPFATVGPFVVPAGVFQNLDGAETFEETTGTFAQTSDTFAGYGHLKWNLLPRWTIEHGMRFTHEKKTGFVANEFTQGTGIAFMALIGSQEFEQDLSRSEFAFTPKEVLRFDWNDDVGFFASWARGFKAGGFNELAVNPENGLTFEPEETTAWELGSKMRLLGGVATLDTTLFWQDVTNLQVFVVDPGSQLVSVENAGEARSRGVEIDASWLPVDWLTLIGTLGYLDAKYLDFPFGTCAQDRVDTDGSGDNFCNLSGQQATHTPEWMGTLVSSVRLPIRGLPLRAASLGVLSGLAFTGNLTLEYNDVQFADQSNDFRMRQPSYVRLNASVGFADEARGWSLGITGENLTDVVTVSQTRDVTLAGGNFVHVQNPPRLFFGTFRWGF